MSDLSGVEDDDDFTLGDDDGEGDEGQGADGDEGQDDEGEEGGQDPEDDDGEAQGEDGLKGQSQRPSRSSRAVRSAKATAKEANARAERLERELDELRRQVQAPPAPRLSQAEIDRLEREEDERIALMTPAEQVRYLRQNMRQEFQGQLQNERIQMREDLDRRSFQQMTGTNKLAASYADRVEDLVRQRRAAGEFVTRDIALAFLVGQDALKKAGVQGQKQKGEAKRRINAVTTRPGRGSGSQPSERGRRSGDESFEDLEKRLSGQVF